MKKFVFLYPQPDYIDHQLGMGSSVFLLQKNPTITSAQDLLDQYRTFYSHNLNRCVQERYRTKGFEIIYTVFDEGEISDVIKLQPNDRVIKAGLSFKTHTTEVDGKCPYPDQNHIIEQIGTTEHLVIGGFHLWDCVQKLAQAAYMTGIDTLVDEDLTELFDVMMHKEGFRHDSYPTFQLNSVSDKDQERYLKHRDGKPWMIHSRERLTIVE